PQNRAGRVILVCDHYTPSDTILHRLGWTQVLEMHKRNKAVFVYKALHDMSPPHLSGLFTQLREGNTAVCFTTTRASFQFCEVVQMGTFHVLLMTWQCLEPTPVTS
ncbi:hypothetical protein Bbelb_393160, partial [Branchiostoma belcheri]